MKEVLKYLAYLVGAVIVAQVLSLPYFQPKQPWPDWLLAVSIVGVIFGMVFVFGHHQRKN